MWVLVSSMWLLILRNIFSLSKFIQVSPLTFSYLQELSSINVKPAQEGIHFVIKFSLSFNAFFFICEYKMNHIFTKQPRLFPMVSFSVTAVLLPSASCQSSTSWFTDSFTTKIKESLISNQLCPERFGIANPCLAGWSAVCFNAEGNHEVKGMTQQSD